MIKDKNTIWIHPSCISKVECKEATDIPCFSWCVTVHTKDGESHDVHYNFNQDAAIKFANEYVAKMN